MPPVLDAELSQVKAEPKADGRIDYERQKLLTALVMTLHRRTVVSLVQHTQPMPSLAMDTDLLQTYQTPLVAAAAVNCSSLCMQSGTACAQEAALHA